ncbi:MAG: TonB-dependent receptor, partial [Gammaproteobacteria bacterium]|nr:TonB-dependent receptor [Gammaproteobacteria bacterium]
MSPKTKSHPAIWSLVAGAAMLLTGNALAQEEAQDEATAEDDDDVEVVIVRGIRTSLEQSLERKRQADHFVDAITAEDIGAFPEQNLAEALQRI